MDLIQLGALMRQEREARKLSLGEVTEATKISRRILVAFENGEKEHFPHPVYAKGFVRNYSKLLGLDPLESVRVLEREYCPEDPCDDKRENVGISLMDLKDPSGKALSSGSRPWGAMLIVFLLVAILAGLIWYMAQSGREHVSTETESTATAEAGQHVQQPELPAQEVVEALPTNVGASAGVVDANDGQEVVEPVQAVGSKHMLVVTLTEGDACWMGVLRNDDEPGETPWFAEYTVRPGQSQSFEFSGKRTFRFGRLESVTLELDGKVRPASGSGVVDVVLP